MPYIYCATTAKLNNEQKRRLKSGFGAMMELIPGKREAVLMVELADERSMYFRGEEVPCAYLDTKFAGKVEFEYQQKFTEAALALVAEVCELPLNNVYLTLSEYAAWGTGGTLKPR